MNEELEAIRAVVETDVDTRDMDRARTLADAYVAAHPDEFTEHTGMTLPDLVKSVDVFRAANMLDSQWRSEAWLLHRFEPQNIGGDVLHQVRIPTPTGAANKRTKQ